MASSKGTKLTRLARGFGPNGKGEQLSVCALGEHSKEHLNYLPCARIVCYSETEGELSLADAQKPRIATIAVRVPRIQLFGISKSPISRIDFPRFMLIKS